MKIRNSRLTGKTRHRTTRFRRKLILQVEERAIVDGGEKDGTPVVFWRDGVMDDLLELHEMRVPRKVRRGNAK